MNIKPGTKLIAINPCMEKFTEKPMLTVGESYDVTFKTAYGFTINNQGNPHHFANEDYEKYFQSINEDELLALGFERNEWHGFHGWSKRVGGFNIEVTKTFLVKLHSNTLSNCKTITDLKHLIRILGI